MFPVLNIEIFQSKVEMLANQDLKTLRQEDIPLLACAYCVFALGADENAGRCTEEGWTYLAAAFNLFTHIVSMPYFVSVQALLLLTVTLKSRNKDGCGAQALTQAIRIAQSLGLHHISVTKTESTIGEALVHADVDLDARCWWVCYCLEISFGLGIGRPILIRGGSYHQVIPESTGNFFCLWIRLCIIQSRLYEAIYARPAEARNGS